MTTSELLTIFDIEDIRHLPEEIMSVLMGDIKKEIVYIDSCYSLITMIFLMIGFSSYMRRNSHREKRRSKISLLKS